MPFLRFPLDRGKAFIRHYASSSAQRHGCTNCKKRSLCSVFCKTFAYHLCAVKRLTAFFCFGCNTAFFGYAFLSSFGTQTLKIFACEKREALSFFFMFDISYAPTALFLFMIINSAVPALSQKGTTSGQVLLTRRNFHKRKSRLGFTDCPSSSQ